MVKDLLDSEYSGSEDGGAHLPNGDLKVNQDFARKFEYNKKREERQRLEEKLGKDSRKRKRNNEDEDSSEDSTSESEDEGELDTEAVDAEMLATINAIRSKDPRIYDANANFYTSLDEDANQNAPKAKKEKPMHLQDYHRQNLLNGMADEEDETAPLTHNQEQQQLKKNIITEMHAVAEGSSAEDGEDGFLVAKEKPRKQKKEPVLDVENADKDPDTFLSNFMSSRAWAYPDERNLVPFESDDEEEDQRAEEFEEAYNMRFENPEKSNEKLRSHARDMAARYSVRRDEINPRQKRREVEKAKKEAAKQGLREEKARLRKLRIEEAEEKVKRIKHAAGLHSKDLEPEDWARFVDEDWDDANWEQEMQKRFGEQYYAEEDYDSEEGADGKRELKKPNFDDDIDIKDIVPDFDDEDERLDFNLSEDEETALKPENKSPKKQKEDKKREAKKERRIIEQLVENQLELELDHALPRSGNRSGFRYRETSPKSFGMTPRDILLADDSQLNQYAGLKKLAAFRDPEKKQKDQKHLGKKARLRKWRAEVFGSEEGLQASELVPSKAGKTEEGDGSEENGGGVNVITSAKKRRRGKNKKQKMGEAEI